MKRRLPLLAGSIVLTACNSGKINVIDKITDGELVSFCEEAVKCSAEIKQDYYLFQCVDNIRDAKHKAVSLGCETEYVDLFTCNQDEIVGQECASDFDSAEDWSDHQEDLYDDYADSVEACEDEAEDYSDCINEFMGIETSSGGDDTGYNGYYE